MPVPACVYIVFHPRSAIGEQLADYVFRWLRLHDEQGLSGDNTSIAVPVYYRSALQGGRVHPPIGWDEAEHNFVVVLSDDTLNLDDAWIAALQALSAEASPDGAPHPTHRRILPVMLSMSFGALTFLGRGRDPLRVFNPDDPPDADKALTWGRRLRRALTEAMVRWMYADDRAIGDDARPDRRAQDDRLQVFISHAKADGRHVAYALRDGLARVSKLRTWFDENDLLAGADANSVMAGAAGQSTGGMIVVASPEWPGRPWCRHEAATARRPRAEGPGGRVFTVQPVVVTRVMSTTTKYTWSRLPPSISQVPCLDWRDEPALLEALVDRLMLELLLARIARCFADQRADTHPGTWYLTFLPDAFTLQHLAEHLEGHADEPLSRVVYPGHGLRPVERWELEQARRALLPAGVKLISLESLAEQGAAVGPLRSGFRLGLSAGGGTPDVRAAGAGSVHAKDLQLRLTQQLLSAGAELVYGGTLTDEKDNLTEALIAAAAAWRFEASFDVDGERASDAARADVQRPVVHNFAAWPYAKGITERRRGDLLGLVRFETVTPPGWYRGRPFAALSDADKASLEGLLTPDALTAMRGRIAQACDARVFFAGKIHGWDGWLPGIAEELLAADAAGTPCLLLGGLGGQTRLLVDFLAQADAPYPAELTWDAEQRARPDDERRRQWLSGTYLDERRRRMEALQDALVDLRARVHRGESRAVRLDDLDRTHASATSMVRRVLQFAHAAGAARTTA